MTYSTDFEMCWKCYPLKKGKFQAYKTWQKVKGDLPETSVITKAIQDQKTERAFLKRQNRFSPHWKHFSSWLNAGCWTDECELPLRVAKAVHNTPGNGVDAMVRALNILENISEAKFQEFCKSTNMPVGDIEAVLLKQSGKYDVTRLAWGIGG